MQWVFELKFFFFKCVLNTTQPTPLRLEAQYFKHKTTSYIFSKILLIPGIFALFLMEVVTVYYSYISASTTIC